MAQGIGLDLKRLRESAIPKLSIRVMADLLGLSASGYVHYEDKIKGDRLPISFVEKILPILTARGVAREDVIALSGAPDIVNAPANIDAMRLGLCLRAIEEILFEESIDLQALDRADLVSQLYMTHLNLTGPDLREAAFRIALRHLQKLRTTELKP